MKKILVLVAAMFGIALLDALGKAGFTHVYNLTGGYPDLVSAGAKVATS